LKYFKLRGIVRSVYRNKYKKPGKYKEKTFLPKYAAYTYSYSGR